MRPTTLPPLAEAILEELSKHPESSEIVLGGGIALKHYLDFRPTQDINAWWRSDPRPDVLGVLKGALGRVANEHGLALNARGFGTTESLEFVDRAGKKEFSFQIARRDVGLDDPIPSAWPPVLIETLRDNLGSKMNALVNRGAPRDFLDVFELNARALVSVEEAWEVWKLTNLQTEIVEGKGDIIGHLERLEQRRPLESIPAEDRPRAERLRRWYRDVFAATEAL